MPTTAQHNINEVLAKQRRVIREIETKSEMFLDAVARLGVNASRDNVRPDTWTDRTGNLRSSITHFLRTVGRRNEAIVFAGMEYGVHVHFKSGYRVLVPPPQREVERMYPLLKV